MKKSNKWFLMISSITAITSPIFISAAVELKIVNQVRKLKLCLKII
ncbi:hypothetical protein [Mycoplasmopsis felis]